MAFQQGLSGLNASSRNLDVIGNNIANANTVGMKMSRTEFADIVASSIGAAGGSNVGLGVSVETVSQQFTQGNITITGNDLDVAINGRGFFQLTLPDGSLAYSRNGQFKLDATGNIVSNAGGKLMGYPTDLTGQATSVTAQPLSLPTSAPIAAKQTLAITAEFNLTRAPIPFTTPAPTLRPTPPTARPCRFMTRRVCPFLSASPSPGPPLPRPTTGTCATPPAIPLSRPFSCNSTPPANSSPR
jgi:flagellar hook protein FlgE